MSEGIASGYQVKGRIVCNGCDHVFERGYRVTNGPVAGIFHSAACFNEQLVKHEQAHAVEEAAKTE